MKEWTVEYSTDKSNRLTTTIQGKTLTDAYLNFMAKYPKEYEVTGITEKRLGNENG